MSLNGSATAGGTLKGKITGLKTIHGYSAYEVAVINGFRGTEAEWLLSLVGEKGDNVGIFYDEETETLIIEDLDSPGGSGGSGGVVNLDNYYNKDEINAMFGSYVNDIAEIVGGV